MSVKCVKRALTKRRSYRWIPMLRILAAFLAGATQLLYVINQRSLRSCFMRQISLILRSIPSTEWYHQAHAVFGFS